jgi:hypothetical protein
MYMYIYKYIKSYTYKHMNIHMYIHIYLGMIDQMTIAQRAIRTDWPQMTGKGTYICR